MKRPEQSLESACKVAKGLNKNICKQVAAGLDDELAEEVWNLTQEELDKGWAWLDEDCCVEKHLLAKRFGLRQGPKTRLIDDCSVGGSTVLVVQVRNCGSTLLMRWLPILLGA